MTTLKSEALRYDKDTDCWLVPNDVVETAEAENARLREALKPFAGSADDADKGDAKDGESWMVLAGWLREARAALQETKP